MSDGPIGSNVYDVEKKCPDCGAEWVGKAFSPNKDPKVPRVQQCDECYESAEAAFRDRAKVRNESEQPPELGRPKRVG